MFRIGAHIAAKPHNVPRAQKVLAKTTNRPQHNVRSFILPSQSVVFCDTYLPSSFLSKSAIIHYSVLYATIPYSCVEFRCAVQSSALCEGLAALLICSTGTVVAHFSIGVTEHRHRQSGAVRPSRDRRGRRQDNVRSVVPGLHRSSSAGADLLCQIAPVSMLAPCVSTLGLLFIDALRAACVPCHGHADRHPPGLPPDRRHRTFHRSRSRA